MGSVRKRVGASDGVGWRRGATDAGLIDVGASSALRLAGSGGGSRGALSITPLISGALASGALASGALASGALTSGALAAAEPAPLATSATARSMNALVGAP